MQHIPVKSLPEPALAETFIIRDIMQLDERDFYHKLHRHDYFHVLVFKEASGRHNIDFIDYPVTDNSVFVIRPGQVHEIVFNAGSTGYVVQFSQSFYPSSDVTPDAQLRMAASRNFYQFNNANFKILMAALEQVYSEYTNKGYRYEEMIKAQMSSFFIGLIREGRRNPISQTNGHQQERLERFLLLIERHIHTHKQPSQYAEMMNLSAYQLNAITKASLGKTCSELINEQIILEAKRYLLATTNQVTQVAYHMGYEDVSYFIRFFKKHTGHSPDAFRREFQLSTV